MRRIILLIAVIVLIFSLNLYAEDLITDVQGLQKEWAWPTAGEIT